MRTFEEVSLENKKIIENLLGLNNEKKKYWILMTILVFELDINLWMSSLSNFVKSKEKFIV